MLISHGCASAHICPSRILCYKGVRQDDTHNQSTDHVRIDTLSFSVKTHHKIHIDTYSIPPASSRLSASLTSRTGQHQCIFHGEAPSPTEKHISAVRHRVQAVCQDLTTHRTLPPCSKIAHSDHRAPGSQRLASKTAAASLAPHSTLLSSWNSFFSLMRLSARFCRLSRLA